ncbi:M23 family metallopeptidase [Burkholderia arboris]|uniref:M23 family metallopeptidase n=1 Tax=Burkholderia arboris TaxID=488730 RepID=UPI001CF18C5F|nr:M23 family metallopeptidase [Burkholderia arboris]MCA8050881.1 M23 family metallopeptidase [Burkholderia arboris]HEP6430604.1 M23 family metallopeptidase [Burkholderia cenocepacia]
MKVRLSVSIWMVLTFLSAHAGAQCLADPVNIPTNMVTSTFGKTRMLAQYSSPRVHWGVDFQARNPSNPGQGAQLKAVDNGTIIGAGFWGSGYGNRVALRRTNGDIVTYNHLASVEPKLKSGGAVGFRENSGSPLGTTQVAVGDIVGVAGGTGNHMDRYDLPIHLHLEYVTGYGGTKLRETNDGTNKTRSHYLRNALEYMCKTYPFAPGAGQVTQGTGGQAPTPIAEGGAAASETVPTSADQIYEAQRTQPTVTDRERYGFPDVPPYQTYDGMSESQIVDAEMLRRALDTEWEVRLTDLSERGLMAEISRMFSARLWMQRKISERRARIEAMQSMVVAYKTNRYLTPKVQAAYSRVTNAMADRKIAN